MEFQKWKYKNLQEIMDQVKELNLDLTISQDFSVFKKTVKVGNYTIPNSLAVHPMEGCDSDLEGAPTDLTTRRYKMFAEGGAGLIWFEAISAVPEGRNFPNQLYITEKNVESYKKIVQDIIETHENKFGVKPVIVAQLTHSGRFSKPTGKPAPIFPYHDPNIESKHAYCKDFEPISDEYLANLEDEYVKAAVLLKEAGFHGIDLKCCHKYLVSELLGGFTREGKYGGSFENRTRFLVNVFKKVNERLEDSVILCSRMNIYDKFPYPYGFGVNKDDYTKPDFTEPIQLIKRLQNYGLAMINCTMSTPYYEPHVNRPYNGGTYIPDEHPLQGVDRMINGIAEIAKACPDICVVGTGYSYMREYAPYFAASSLLTGKSTMVGFGRGAFAYPEMFNQMLMGNPLPSSKVCVACSKCAELLRGGQKVGCVVRDNKIYAPIYQKFKLGVKS